MGIKTGIKIKVNPEQSRLIQEICFKNGIGWGSEPYMKVRYTEKSYLSVREAQIEWSNYDSLTDKITELIDVDLFIRTNGTCEESSNLEAADFRRILAKEFVKFLHDNTTAMHRFKNNSKSFACSHYSTLELFLYKSKIDPKYWLLSDTTAFSWTTTPEGSNYWSTLHNKWKTKLKELQDERKNTNTTNLAEEFSKFLTDNNAELNFAHNSISYTYSEYTSLLAFLQNSHVEPDDWLIVHNTAFKWEDTPEGFNYWDDLNNKWQTKLKQLKAIKDCVSPVMDIKDEIHSHDINTFINFLKDKNIYEEYLNESKYISKDCIINYLKDTDVDKKDWINDTDISFDWSYTDSGRTYWQQINHQWEELVINENKTTKTLEQKDKEMHTKKASKIMLKMFDDYLIKHNCYDEYWDLNKHCTGMTYEELRVHFGQVAPHRWLNQASISFACNEFDDTASALWNNLNSGWEDICYRYQEELENNIEEKLKKDITVADLNEYLRQALCFTEYWNNHEELNELSSINEAEEYFNKKYITQWINCAFNWQNTEEGEKYWKDIHNDWIAWLAIYHSETGVEEPTTNLCTEISAHNKENKSKTKENKMTRKIVTFNLIDNDKGLEVKDALVATYKDVLIEDDIETAKLQLVMDKDVKSKIVKHNEKRATIIDRDIRERTGNEVMLQPIQLKDLTWEVK